MGVAPEPVVGASSPAHPIARQVAVTLPLRWREPLVTTPLAVKKAHRAVLVARLGLENGAAVPQATVTEREGPWWLCGPAPLPQTGLLG